jgi:limonene-1,2-epoxide hydrolase
MKIDATFRGRRGRQLFEELGVYEVKDDKIVQQQFFY